MGDNTLKKHVPAGTQDFLEDRCVAKRRLEDAVLSEFLSHGYSEVETPVFEYDEVFTMNSAPYTDENVLRFFEPSGRILTLRPDMTGPIARVAASGLLARGGPLRLCYAGNVYGRKPEERRVETTQAGIELIGAQGPEADTEVISLAIESLLAAGLSSFTVDVGHVAYFEGLVNEAGLQEADAERVRALIDSKNTVELADLLGTLDIPEVSRKRLLDLPGMFGDTETLDSASTDNELCRLAIENLRMVAGELERCGLQAHFSIDLGMLHNFNYYTGIVFRGLASGTGTPILSGGRYDGLLAGFGHPAPAIGFAADITALVELPSLLSEAGTDSDQFPTVLRFAPGDRARAWVHARKLRCSGRSVILAPEGWSGAPQGLEMKMPEEDDLRC